MNAVELLKTIDLEANVILNPGTKFQKLFVKEEIEAICDNSIFDVFLKGISKIDAVLFLFGIK